MRRFDEIELVTGRRSTLVELISRPKVLREGPVELRGGTARAVRSIVRCTRVGEPGVHLTVA